MPGFLDLDLEATARRLSFTLSPSPSPQPRSRAPRSPRRQAALPPIAEDPAEHQAVETSVPPSPWTLPPSRPPSQSPSCALYPVPDELPPMTYAPPATSLSPFQQPEAVALARELERLRDASSAAEAALQQLQRQAWAAEAARPQPQPQQLRLYTVEGNPAGYKTKWEELHPVSQELLLQIEDKMREYRYESEQLDQCSRLYDPSMSNKSFEFDASHITQDIGSMSTIMDREKASIQSLMAVVKEMMWNTDFAIRSYVKLRPRFVHRGAGIANAGFADPAGSTGAPTGFNQPLTMAPTFHCYSGVARRPSPFMQHTVAGFEKQLEECCKLIGELEQLVQMKNDKTYPDSLESLSKVLSNVHDYFIHVTSKVENLHQHAETIRTQYLNDWQRRGNWSDPFLEADRRVTAKQEAAARRVHPTLHLPPPVQPTALVAVPVMASQPQQSSFPTLATYSSACATLSTPPSAVPPSSIRTSPFPLTNPFSSSGSLLQPTPFGSASVLTLGSTPSAFLCGTSTPSSASLLALGGTSLFPTPSGGGTTAIGFNHAPVTRGRTPRRRC